MTAHDTRRLVRFGVLAGTAAAATGIVFGLAGPASAATTENSITVCASGAGDASFDAPPAGTLPGYGSQSVFPGQCTTLWVSAEGPRPVNFYSNGALRYSTNWDASYPLNVTI